MGDMADQLTEQGIAELIRHQARECDNWCQYCVEDWEDDQRGEK